MQRAKEKVNPEQWMLFEMTWKDDRSPMEVAAELGIDAAKIHKARFNVARAIRQYIHELSQDYYGPDNTDGGDSEEK